MRITFLILSVLSCFYDYVLSRILNEGTIGSSVILDCQRASLSTSGVEWNVPYNGRIVYTGSYIKTEQSANDLLNRIYKIGKTLRIVNVQKSDEGIYECLESSSVRESFNLSLPVLISSTVPAYFRSLNVDATQKKLIVGSMNAFFSIDLSGDTPIQGKIIPKTINPIQSNVDNCKLSHSVTPYCQNHIRILAKQSEVIWLACGTNGDAPTGYELNITSGSYTQTGFVPCSNNPFHNSSCVYTASNDTTVTRYMYYGSVYYSDKTIQRPIYNTDGTIREYMKGVDSTNWMNEPEFVGSFELAETVLYFFREKAVEVDPNDPKTYSRVAKVCKKDKGGNTQLRNKWTSFQKARLICSIPNTYPVIFDIIQDVVTHDKITFYGLFTSGSALTHSVICAFTLSDIESAFAGQFKYQPAATSYWIPVTSVPSPRPGNCVDDSLTLTDENLEFIANKPLMHNSVDSLQGKPLFILENEALQQLELHENTSELVFYTASSRGNVYKLFSKNSQTYILSNYSVSDVNFESNIIWTMKQEGDYLYVGTDNTVRAIQIINCEQYRWVDSCVKDPHCIWINNTNIINDDQCFNRCRSISFFPENSQGVITHENHDLSSITTVNCLPTSPIYFRPINTETDSIDIEWSIGNYQYNIISYVVKYREVKGDWTEKETDLDVHSMSIIGLNSNCFYEIAVCAKNNMGDISEIDIIVVSTGDVCSASPGTISAIVLVVFIAIFMLLQILCVVKLLKDRGDFYISLGEIAVVMLVSIVSLITVLEFVCFVALLIKTRFCFTSNTGKVVAAELIVVFVSVVMLPIVCVFEAKHAFIRNKIHPKTKKTGGDLEGNEEKTERKTDTSVIRRSVLPAINSPAHKNEKLKSDTPKSRKKKKDKNKDKSKDNQVTFTDQTKDNTCKGTSEQEGHDQTEEKCKTQTKL